MKCFVAAFTAWSVLIHGMFGCCGHLQADSVGVEPHCHHCHHEVADTFELAGATTNDTTAACGTSAPVVPTKCIHAACHWLLGDVVESIDQLSALGVLSPSHAQPAMFLPRETAFFSFVTAGPENLAPPLRLHLALGILQI